MAENKQSQITDKELLAICNLSNLKMEFANIVKDKDEKTGKILSNHTIYSLLEKEITGQKKRENLRKENIELFTGEVLPHYNPYDFKNKQYLNDKEDTLGKNLGAFFRENDDTSVRKGWIYHSKNDLIEEAPSLIEYFDSYEESKKDLTNEGVFLEEWEIVFGGDSYSIAEKTAEIYKEIFEKNTDFEINSDIPKRGSGQLIKLIMKYKDKIKDKVVEQVGKISLPLDFLEKNIFGEIFKELLDSKIKDTLKEEVEKMAEKQLEKTDDKYDVIKHFNLVFNLLETELEIVICKNIKKKYLVIAIRNSNSLEKFETNLNEGNYANEIIAIDTIYHFYKQNQDYHEFKIIFTGIGKAGKLATLYGIIYNEEYKVFFKDTPNSIPLFFKFSLDSPFKNLENLALPFEIEETNGLELTITILFTFVNLMASIITTGGTFTVSTIALIYISIFTKLFNFVKTSINNLEKDKKKREFFQELINNKILEDGYITDKINSKESIFNSKFLNNIPFETYLQLSILYYFYEYSLKKEYSDDNTLILTTLDTNDIRTNRINLIIYFDFKKYITKIIKQEEKEIVSQGVPYLVEKELNSSDKLIFTYIVLKTVLKNCYQFYQNFKNNSSVNGYYFDDSITTFYNKDLSAIKDIQVNVTSNLFVPYLDSTCGNINCEKISDEYKASFIRSCFSCNDNLKEKNIDEKIKDEDYNSVPLAMSTPNDKETLNESILKIMESKGETIALSEHYKSTMKEFSENPKLIEKYYVIEENKYNKNTADLKLGIFNENKEFAPEKVGFAYSSLDRIKVGLTTIPIYFLDTIDVSSISTTKVCNGATLECSCGTSPKKLVVTSQSNYITEDSLVATKDDNVPLLNVGDFGACRCNDNKPCKNFISLGSWNGVSPNNTINGKNILLNTCTISCGAGGTITIKNSNCKSNAN